jgi:hypothetical protein
MDIFPGRPAARFPNLDRQSCDQSSGLEQTKVLTGSSNRQLNRVGTAQGGDPGTSAVPTAPMSAREFCGRRRPR